MKRARCLTRPSSICMVCRLSSFSGKSSRVNNLLLLMRHSHTLPNSHEDLALPALLANLINYVNNLPPRQGKSTSKDSIFSKNQGFEVLGCSHLEYIKALTQMGCKHTDASWPLPPDQSAPVGIALDSGIWPGCGAWHIPALPPVSKMSHGESFTDVTFLRKIC
jgi:hypothetical protein